MLEYIYLINILLNIGTDVFLAKFTYTIFYTYK